MPVIYLGYVSDIPERRAEDINRMFADPEVKAILTSIGGDHSCHLLPWLDWDLIRFNPKIFMGFSDITVLNIAIWHRTGLVTFNGPTLLTEVAEYPQMPAYSEEYLLRAITRPEPVGNVEPSDWWTEEYLDWGQQLDTTRPRAVQPSSGWTWLKGGSSEGVLIGGCIESLQHLRGTPFWPDWQDAILFIETSEDHPDPAMVDGMLMDYTNMGVLPQLRGLLVGRPTGYAGGQRQELREVIQERTSGYDFPVITDMDFGHTTPMFTLPIGCRASIDSAKREFAIIEPAVK